MPDLPEGIRMQLFNDGIPILCPTMHQDILKSNPIAIMPWKDENLTLAWVREECKKLYDIHIAKGQPKFNIEASYIEPNVKSKTQAHQGSHVNKEAHQSGKNKITAEFKNQPIASAFKAAELKSKLANTVLHRRVLKLNKPGPSNALGIMCLMLQHQQQQQHQPSPFIISNSPNPYFDDPPEHLFMPSPEWQGGGPSSPPPPPAPSTPIPTTPPPHSPTPPPPPPPKPNNVYSWSNPEHCKIILAKACVKWAGEEYVPPAEDKFDAMARASALAAEETLAAINKALGE
ncbi:hypothetical protein DACRYDRAFT_15504 [Dacryopinax primogenitus]|uniref:Uncharacterized protein n=1 Tax=Dacryopinax primogenitus (strain DJM 731) TaxID=1858805 RepID=M5G013_DACPD|nr:uncharacterized protein DACRYDRAFT_15504 [Dacryopinax primogenitus]EJU02094.1 hypothetical protein DACRYDRAFT_15504 [Dacryopinax primogenitus]